MVTWSEWWILAWVLGVVVLVALVFAARKHPSASGSRVMLRFFPGLDPNRTTSSVSSPFRWLVILVVVALVITEWMSRS